MPPDRGASSFLPLKRPECEYSVPSLFRPPKHLPLAFPYIQSSLLYSFIRLPAVHRSYSSILLVLEISDAVLPTSLEMFQLSSLTWLQVG